MNTEDEEESPATVRSARPEELVVPKQRRGYRPKKPVSSTGDIDRMVNEIEQKEGKVEPVFVMVMLRAYRSFESTNRAQKEIIQRLGRELAALRMKKGGSVIAVCLTVGVIVLGAYALAWRTLSWAREEERRLEEGDKTRCSSLFKGRFGNGEATLRCELDEHHLGPHTAKLDGYVRSHWE